MVLKAAQELIPEYRASSNPWILLGVIPPNKQKQEKGKKDTIMVLIYVIN